MSYAAMIALLLAASDPLPLPIFYTLHPRHSKPTRKVTIKGELHVIITTWLFVTIQ